MHTKLKSVHNSIEQLVKPILAILIRDISVPTLTLNITIRTIMSMKVVNDRIGKKRGLLLCDAHAIYAMMYYWGKSDVTTLPSIDPPSPPFGNPSVIRTCYCPSLSLCHPSSSPQLACFILCHSRSSLTETTHSIHTIDATCQIGFERCEEFFKNYKYPCTQGGNLYFISCHSPGNMNS